MNPLARASPWLALGGLGTGIFALLTLLVESHPAPYEWEQESHDWAMARFDTPSQRFLWEEVLSFGPVFDLLMVAVVFVPGALLVARRQYWLGGAGMALAVAAPPLIRTLKELIDRPRPMEGTDAFPSGHASSAALTAFLLCPLLVALRPAFQAHWKGYAIGGAAFALVEGLERLPAMRHWPLDILAGWAFGIAYGSFALVLLDIAREKDRERLETPS